VLLSRYVEYRCLKHGLSGKLLKRLSNMICEVIFWQIESYLYRHEPFEDDTVKLVLRDFDRFKLIDARMKRIEGQIIREALCPRD
jgi:hypothetical protein